MQGSRLFILAALQGINVIFMNESVFAGSFIFAGYFSVVKALTAILSFYRLGENLKAVLHSFTDSKKS